MVAAPTNIEVLLFEAEVNPKPSPFNPQPQTLISKPQTPNLKEHLRLPAVRRCRNPTPQTLIFSSSSLLSSLESSDTKVYEPQIRARLGTLIPKTSNPKPERALEAARRDAVQLCLTRVERYATPEPYRGISLIRNRLPPKDYQGPRHRPTVGSYGGAVSYERGTPVRDTRARRVLDIGLL